MAVDCQYAFLKSLRSVLYSRSHSSLRPRAVHLEGARPDGCPAFCSWRELHTISCHCGSLTASIAPALSRASPNALALPCPRRFSPLDYSTMSLPGALAAGGRMDAATYWRGSNFRQAVLRPRREAMTLSRKRNWRWYDSSGGWMRKKGEKTGEEGVRKAGCLGSWRRH